MSTKRAASGDFEHVRVLESVLKSRPEPDFADRLAASGRGVVLGFIGERAVGYVVLNDHPEYSLFARLGIPELQDLNVLPEYRGRGMGAMLVGACEDMARDNGATQLGLAVGLDKSYGAAQRLYVRLGYMPDGFGISYDRAPVTPGEMRPVDDNLCLMMVKDLTPSE